MEQFKRACVKGTGCSFYGLLGTSVAVKNSRKRCRVSSGSLESAGIFLIFLIPPTPRLPAQSLLHYRIYETCDEAAPFCAIIYILQAIFS